MSRVSEYIDSLKGKEIDPEVAMQTVLQLHNEEMDTSSAKIASLEVASEEKDRTIAEKNTALRDQMAANWELANRVPVTTNDNELPTPAPNNPQPKTMDEVLYGKED